MKSRERHQLKQNDFAATLTRLTLAATANRDRLLIITVVVVVLLASVGGFAWWRKSVSDQAGERLGAALAIAQAQIVPASSLPGATQASGTYPTEQARDEAALEAYRAVVSEFPGTAEAEAAGYHAANALVTLGRYQEAEAAYQAIVDGGGDALYVQSARLGLAETATLQGNYDAAVAILTDLSADREGLLPVDGVLMQLAEVEIKAGRKDEARAAFQRVVDEFPDSPYAPQARQRMAALE